VDAVLAKRLTIQMIPFWGMLGLWTTRVGFHNTWEFYFYNVSRDSVETLR